MPYDGSDPFNTDHMRALFRLGHDGAVAGTAWKAAPTFQPAGN